MGKNWSWEALPSLSGKTIIVTGANAGIGLETTSTLAAKGALVIMACRNLEKAAEAARQIQARHPDARVSPATLDLADLTSVREFSRTFTREHQQLDVLVNNAGIMTPPLGRTKEGFELQFGTNFVGHFLLTMLMLPLLNRSRGSRVVTLSSVAHWTGNIDFDNLNAEKRYSKWGAYAQSKLANLLFMYELQRRLEQSGVSTISTGAHPGVTASELTRHSMLLRITQGMIAQTTAQGSLPSLRAAIDPGVRGGDYYGPGSYLTLTLYGGARKQQSSRRSRNPVLADRLWTVAERLCGERYPSTRDP